MANVEAAASLFGTEDSASDPFASLGINDEKPRVPVDNNASVTSSGYLVETSGHSFVPPSAPSTSQAEPAHMGVLQGDLTSAYPPAASPVPGGASYGQNYSHSQGWQDGHNHNSHLSNSWISGQDSQNQILSPNTPNTHDPYAPYPNGSATTITSTNLSSHHTYDLHAPAQAAQSTVYSVPSQPYGPYTPTPSTQTESTTTSQYGVTYQIPNQPAYTSSEPPSIPAPPAPKAHLVRPKIVNAYDPPFPTTKSSRRTSARPAPTQQVPAYNPYANSAGNSYQSSYPQNSAYPPYTNSAPVGLPSTNGTADYGTQWSHTQSPNTQTHPIDGLPAQNDSLTNSYAPPATIAPYNTPSHQLSYGSYSDENTVAEQANRPLSVPLPDGPIANPVAHSHVNTVVHSDISSTSELTEPLEPVASTPSRDNLHDGGSTPPQGLSPSFSSPVLQWRASADVARTTSPEVLQSHSRRASHDSIPPPPKRAFTPNSNESRVTQRTASPATRSYSPSITPLHRTTSPASLAHATPHDVQAQPYDPYAPPKPSTNKALNGFTPPAIQPLQSSLHAGPPQTQGAPSDTGDVRTRSMSNGSAYHSHSTEDPYAPPKSDRRQTYSASGFSYGSSQSGQLQLNDPSPYAYAPTSSYQPAVSGEQELVVKNTQLYAPSPSLVGSNDPLGRTSARAPIVSFGFGGKLVTCFHGADSLHTGFDVALSARNSTGVHVRVLNKLIPQSALDTSSASFPGPLFSDPGTPTSSLVRTGATTQTKNKKARVVKYLEERAEEISRGLGYVHVGSIEGRREEGKLVIVKLLKVMVENDGKLSGTPQIDSAVRTALVPRLENTSGVTADSSTSVIGLGLSSVPDLSELAITTSVLRPSALDKIQDFLIRGERRQAYHYALDEKLWAHALVIASGIDKESWKEAVNEFLKVELSERPSNGLLPPGHTTSGSAIHGREGLRVAYSLFSGQGAAAVQELHPQTLLSQSKANLPLPHLNPLTPTPLTPNFRPQVSTTPIPSDTLSTWPEIIAMMLTSPLTPETSAALTALGDQLATNQWIEAAHVCYLLSPQTSPIGGVGHQSARFVLLASRSPQVWPGFTRDLDPIIFTEIFEFALSLATPVKGQEPFGGFSHLQAYRLIHAMSLAERGHVQMANRYCEAITATLSRGSPYFTSPFADQLKGLMERILGAPNLDKSGSWIGSKLSKPSLDSIGGWLEGRFTKLVTGESDSPDPIAETKTDSQQYGPFSHYSSISSATQSARSSPQPTMTAYPVPPLRTANGHIDRASSAMDYIRRKPSPVPRIASANATTTSFAEAASFNQANQNHYSPNGSASPEQELITPRPMTDDAIRDDANAQEVSWWGASSYGQNNQTPTAATFMKVDAPVTESSDGFISLMDTPSYAAASPTFANGPKRQSHAVDEEEEDLGFGNSSHKKDGKNEDSQPSPSSSAPTKTAESQRPDPKPAPAASGSWLSRWWKKSDSPAPVKANLGEETSFYYDPELKRWVNKKAGADTTAKPATPPPPPSRAQTASPGKTTPSLPTGTSAGPAPPRAASAIDLSTSPPSKTVMRVRSNLVPPATESAPSTPTGTRLMPGNGPPPPSRPRSQATKRNIRSRYVDVFQAEGGTAS